MSIATMLLRDWINSDQKFRTLIYEFINDEKLDASEYSYINELAIFLKDYVIGHLYETEFYGLENLYELIDYDEIAQEILEDIAEEIREDIANENYRSTN